MSSVSPSPGAKEIDWLAPGTRELLVQAQQEALRYKAAAIAPEHILLSMLLTGKDRGSLLLQQSGIDRTLLHSRLLSLAVSSPQSPTSLERLSPETLECIEQAIALVTYYLPRDKSKAIVLPEHLLLSIFYHPRMQKLFANLSTGVIKLKTRLIEGMEPEFVRHMEHIFLFPQQPAHNQRKILHFASFNKAHSRRILKSVEHPDIQFQHIAGLSSAKKAVQETIAFLHEPKKHQTTPRGLLLLSQSPMDDILFVRAIAGEGRVPLIVVFCSVLIELFLSEAATTYWNEQEREAHARDLIREVFHPIKMFSHCLVYLENLEDIAQSEQDNSPASQARRILLQQLCREFDKLTAQEGVVVIASTANHQRLHTEVLRTGRLDTYILLYKPVQLLPEQVNMPAEKRHSFQQRQLSCPSCHQPVQSQWKHCIYCRVALVKRCLVCGTPHPELSGARYCPECGSDLASP